MLADLTEDPPEQPASPPGSRAKRLDIQGLRAVAVILVVAFHAGLPIQGGFIGVDVFLVISGFVITSMLLRELDRSGTIRFRNFYTRRAKRLLPALALLTTVVVVLSFFFGSSFGSQQTTAKTGLGATYFSANIVIYNDSTQYFAPDAETNPLLHTWTLSVEEQVYLVFPALLLGAWIVGRRLRKGSRRGTAIMLAVVGIPSFLLCTALSFGWTALPIRSPEQFAFYSSITRLWEFGIGAALALVAVRLERIPRGVLVGLGIAGSIAIVYGAFTISGLEPYPGVAVLLPVLGAAAVITSGTHASGPVPRLLSIRPMVVIGDISYSWYLWHWPLIVFGAMVWQSMPWVLVVIGAVSIIPSWLSTRFLEDPIRSNDAIRGRKVIVLAAICTAIPTIACLILAKGADESWGSAEVARMQRQVRDRHVAASHSCDDAGAIETSMGEPGCEFNERAPGPRLFLVGNSVAGQYSEGMIEASFALGSPLTLDTSRGCFSIGGGDAGRSVDRECSDTFTSVVERISSLPPSVVVMSSTWDLGINVGTPAESISGVTREDKQAAMVTSLTDAVGRLREAGHEVIIVLPTPRFFYGARPGEYLAAPRTFGTRNEAHSSAWRPSDCWNVVALRDTAACGVVVSEAEVAEKQALTMDGLQQVAESTGATVMDTRDYFCDEGVCRTNLGKRWLFQDGIHISAPESEAMAPFFAGAITLASYAAAGESPVWLSTACTLETALEHVIEPLGGGRRNGVRGGIPMDQFYTGPGSGKCPVFYPLDSGGPALTQGGQPPAGWTPVDPGVPPGEPGASPVDRGEPAMPAAPTP